MKKVIYFKESNSPFILIDEKILSKNYDTKSYFINKKSSIKYFIALVKLIFTLALSGYKYDLYFTRFADYHTLLITFFARLWNKRSIIVLGGYESVQIPEINYGIYNSTYRKTAVRLSFSNADLLLPNSRALIDHTYTYSKKFNIKVGINTHFPELKTNFKVIPNGYDLSLWKQEQVSKSRQIDYITIAVIDTKTRYQLKGIDKFINAAISFPNKTFLIIGTTKKLLQTFCDRDLPPNLIIINKSPQTELKKHLYNSKVFCLFSLSEGMPNVLSEAMLCGCTPVASNISCVYDIVYNYGYVNQHDDQELINRNLLKALQNHSKLSKGGQKHIKNSYSIEQRETDLCFVINDLLK